MEIGVLLVLLCNNIKHGHQSWISENLDFFIIKYDEIEKENLLIIIYKFIKLSRLKS